MKGDPLLDDRPVLLCGFMGTGKTTVGRLLAQQTKREFADLDDLIVERAGCPIPEIFEREGEAGFRKRERDCLLEQLKQRDGVLALGGGALQDQEVVNVVKNQAVLVFIDTPISTILARIVGDINRPLLTDENGEPKDRSQLYEEMSQKRRDRLPYYRQAHITVKPEAEQKPEQIAEQLLDQLNQFHAKDERSD